MEGSFHPGVELGQMYLSLAVVFSQKLKLPRMS